MDKIKCNKCNKKIGIILFECKCNGKFCMNHRFPDKHDCNYDYKTDYINELLKNNPKIIPEKISTI
jgi:predicted nucleic acid binding AN1-type Zn finger protein